MVSESRCNGRGRRRYLLKIRVHPKKVYKKRTFTLRSCLNCRPGVVERLLQRYGLK